MRASHDGHFKGGVLMRDFVSNLAGKLNDFLDYKHALGIKYDTCRVYLLELDGYNLVHSNRDTLTADKGDDRGLGNLARRKI